MEAFTIAPRGPFRLEESARFGFGQRHESEYDGTMRLAFCVDGYQCQAGVSLTQDAAGVVHGVIAGEAATKDGAAVIAQVARVLSLDHDATGYQALGDRNPVIARLLDAAPGLRPPLFYSPYEAALWAVISMRRPRPTAERWRTRLSEAAGFGIMGELYQTGKPVTAKEAERLAESWRPWRTWVGVLFRAAGPRVLDLPPAPSTRADRPGAAVCDINRRRRAGNRAPEKSPQGG